MTVVKWCGMIKSSEKEGKRRKGGVGKGKREERGWCGRGKREEEGWRGRGREYLEKVSFSDRLHAPYTLLSELARVVLVVGIGVVLLLLLLNDIVLWN